MNLKIPWHAGWIALAVLGGLAVVACAHDAATGVAAQAAPNNAAAAAAATAAPVISPEDKAPPASQTGGFDGQKAYDYTAKQVSFGPRPPDSDAIRQTQAYIVTQLKS
ncbi:MAG TPA: hypothetical protein VGS27_28035, partial [Candidatus Sulfotelmatobacter sp.]|nr:hypothetical protein [Candidatus Sulfotelmatobacter sp.]